MSKQVLQTKGSFVHISLKMIKLLISSFIAFTLSFSVAADAAQTGLVRDGRRYGRVYLFCRQYAPGNYEAQYQFILTTIDTEIKIGLVDVRILAPLGQRRIDRYPIFPNRRFGNGFGFTTGRAPAFAVTVSGGVALTKLNIFAEIQGRSLSAPCAPTINPIDTRGSYLRYSQNELVAEVMNDFNETTNQLFFSEQLQDESYLDTSSEPIETFEYAPVQPVVLGQPQDGDNAATIPEPNLTLGLLGVGVWTGISWSKHYKRQYTKKVIKN